MAVPRFRLAQQVVADLEAISNYAAKQSPTLADRLIEELFRTFDTLAENPEIGTDLGHIRPNLRLSLPSRPASNYLVFYTIVPNGVIIVAVIHSARDWFGMFSRGER